MMWQRGYQGGFTYLAVLFLVAVSGIVLAAAGSAWDVARQRENERELLFVGNQFRRAIGLYYERSPGMVKHYPQQLTDLLKDTRQLAPQRYLRRIYRDPMTGTTDWGLVRAPDGGIMGVYTRSPLAAMKTAGFQDRDITLLGKGRLAEWQFVYAPRQSQIGASFSIRR